jgi:hypothetical protein
VRLGTLAVHHEPPGMQSGVGYGSGGQNPSHSGSGNPQGNYPPVPRAVPASTVAAGQRGAAFRPLSYISVRA